MEQLTNLDAGESVFFSRQLESIKTKVYNVLYPEYKATSLLPVDTSAGPGAETITYRSFDRVGVMKLIADYADDLPRSDVKGKEVTIRVKSLGGSFGYNLQEVRASAKAGTALSQLKANATRQSYEAKVNQLAFFGDAEAGLLGLLNQPDVPANTVQTGVVSGNVTWLGASPKNTDEVLKDMNDAVRDPMTLSKGVEIPDTLLLPLDEYSYVSTTRLAAGTDTTILQFFLQNNPGVTVEWVNELADVAVLPSGGGGPANVMIAYKKSADKLTLELPSLFEMLAVEARGLEFIVNAHARYAGVQVYYPLSMNIVEGI